MRDEEKNREKETEQGKSTKGFSFSSSRMTYVCLLEHRRYQKEKNDMKGCREK
jgi:hypothetical protein